MAREYGCLFIECSAKTRVNVQQCFEELVLKVDYHFSTIFSSLFGQRIHIIDLWLSGTCHFPSCDTHISDIIKGKKKCRIPGYRLRLMRVAR